MTIEKPVRLSEIDIASVRDALNDPDPKLIPEPMSKTSAVTLPNGKIISNFSISRDYHVYQYLHFLTQHAKIPFTAFTKSVNANSKNADYIVGIRMDTSEQRLRDNNASYAITIAMLKGKDDKERLYVFLKEKEEGKENDSPSNQLKRLLGKFTEIRNQPIKQLPPKEEKPEQPQLPSTPAPVPAILEAPQESPEQKAVKKQQELDAKIRDARKLIMMPITREILTTTAQLYTGIKIETLLSKYLSLSGITIRQLLGKNPSDKITYEDLKTSVTKIVERTIAEANPEDPILKKLNGRDPQEILKNAFVYSPPTSSPATQSP